MNKKSKFLRTSFYMLTGSAFMSLNASAYIDPATTSYIIQIVAGIVIACGTVIGIFWNKIKRKFKKKDKNVDENAPLNMKTEQDGQGGIVTADDLLNDEEK